MVVNAKVDEIPARAAALVRTTRIASDTVADTLERREVFDGDVNDLAGGCAHSGAPARRAPESHIRFSPKRRRVRLTVACETATSAAICLRV